MAKRIVSNTGDPIENPSGIPYAYTRVRFQLVDAVTLLPVDGWVASTGERVGGYSETTTNAQGIFADIELHPNDEISPATMYLCKIDAEGFVDFAGAVPASTTPLQWIDFKAQGTPLTPAEISLLTAHINDLTVHSSIMDDLADVTITTPQSNEVISYDASQAKWVNSTVGSTTSVSWANVTGKPSDVTNLPNISGTAGTVTDGVYTTDAGTVFLSPTGTANQEITTNTTTPALKVTQTGSGNALLIQDSSNPDATPFVIDNMGRVIAGHTASTVAADAGGTSRSAWSFQATHTTVGGSGFLSSYWANDANGAAGISISKSRGATPGTNAVVQSGDELGQIGFLGDDGTNLQAAGGIFMEVDGTPGINDMPGRMLFKTTPDNTATPEEAMRISQDKAITMAGDLTVTGTASVNRITTANNVSPDTTVDANLGMTRINPSNSTKRYSVYIGGNSTWVGDNSTTAPYSTNTLQSLYVNPNMVGGAGVNALRGILNNPYYRHTTNMNQVDGLHNQQVLDTDATTDYVYGVYNRLQLQNTSTGIITHVRGFSDSFAAQDSTSDITHYISYLASAITSGANQTVTKGFGFYGDIAAKVGTEANRWNLYMTGTAPNYLKGVTIIGSANAPATLGSNQLFVTGDAEINGALSVGRTNGTHPMTLRSFDASTTNGTQIGDLLGGSVFGGLIESVPSGHMVVTLRENDSHDSFAIVSGGGNYTGTNGDGNYDRLVARFKADGNAIIPSKLKIGGTTNPTYALDVEGDASAEKLYLNNVGATTALATLTGVGSWGALIHLVGNGTAYPNKQIQVAGGEFRIKDNASQTILTLTDAGDLTVEGSLDAASGGTGQKTYATGDILYSDATNSLAKLGVGTAGQVLTLANGLPTWAAAAGGGSGSGSGDMLAATYDPNTVAADAFSMTNMVESSTYKILTSAERTKLSGIATSAEVNVQSDWTATSGDAFIVNKPTISGTNTGDQSGGDSVNDIGYLTIPQSTSTSLGTTDSGKHLYYNSTSTTAVSIPTGLDEGTAFTFVNMGAGVVTISNADTMNLVGAGTTGNRDIAQFGMATAVKVGASAWVISGVGIS